MGGTDLQIDEIHAICNTNLIDSFVLSIEKLHERKFKSSDIFFISTWRKDKDWGAVGKRIETMVDLEERISLYPWNQDREVYVLILRF